MYPKNYVDENAANILYFFYKNNFIRARGSFLLKIYEQIKNNPASAEEQGLKFSIKVVNKAAAILPHN